MALAPDIQEVVVVVVVVGARPWVLGIEDAEEMGDLDEVSAVAAVAFAASVAEAGLETLQG